jgi:hypothetical protein
MGRSALGYFLYHLEKPGADFGFLLLEHLDSHGHHPVPDHFEFFCSPTREIDDAPPAGVRASIIHGDTDGGQVDVGAGDSQASPEWQGPMGGAETSRIIGGAARRRVSCQTVGVIRGGTTQYLTWPPLELLIRTAGTRSVRGGHGTLLQHRRLGGCCMFSRTCERHERDRCEAPGHLAHLCWPCHEKPATAIRERSLGARTGPRLVCDDAALTWRGSPDTDWGCQPVHPASPCSTWIAR